MSSIKERLISFPSVDESLKLMCDEYAQQLGLPGCVGSVLDCVHRGKKCFLWLHAMKLCALLGSSYKQSVSQGHHPGAPNDKHIPRTGAAITDLLLGNGWLCSKYWKVTNNALGHRKVLQGLNLICNSGYHRWPCLVYPVKVGNPESVSMKFGKLVESDQKDIKGVFGIFKIQFRFLKSFTNLCQQKHND